MPLFSWATINKLEIVQVSELSRLLNLTAGLGKTRVTVLAMSVCIVSVRGTKLKLNLSLSHYNVMRVPADSDAVNS